MQNISTRIVQYVESEHDCTLWLHCSVLQWSIGDSVEPRHDIARTTKVREDTTRTHQARRRNKLPLFFNDCATAASGACLLASATAWFGVIGVSSQLRSGKLSLQTDWKSYVRNTCCIFCNAFHNVTVKIFPL